MHRAMVVFAFILGLPMLNSTVAFDAVVGSLHLPHMCQPCLRCCALYKWRMLQCLRCAEERSSCVQVSISTIGLYISYGIPILIRLTNQKDFIPGVHAHALLFLKPRAVLQAA